MEQLQEFEEGGPGGRMSYVQCCCLRVWKRQVTPSHIYSNSDAAQPQTPLGYDHVLQRLNLVLQRLVIIIGVWSCVRL